MFLTKSNFETYQNKICITYQLIPINCACDSKFNVDHGVIFRKGGFVTLSYSNACGIIAELLKECFMTQILSCRSSS